MRVHAGVHGPLTCHNSCFRIAITAVDTVGGLTDTELLIYSDTEHVPLKFSTSSESVPYVRAPNGDFMLVDARELVCGPAPLRSATIA